MPPIHSFALPLLVALATSVWLHAAPGDSLFYFPTHDQPATPAQWGMSYDDVRFESQDGTPLHGWWIHAGSERATGTIVFSHGNAGSVGHHLGFVTWLAKAGYHVLMYDYRGFGQSGGTVSRSGMVQDANAALHFAGKHPVMGKHPLVSYGHSMGGAKSVAAVASGKPAQLRAVVIDATFASYREMAHHVAGRLASGLVSDKWAPLQMVPRISPLPLLVIHGREDHVVPFSQGWKLYQAAQQPKTMFEVDAGGHGNSLARDGGAYRKRMLTWLGKVLSRDTTGN